MIYTPKHFSCDDKAQIVSHINLNGFGTVISSQDSNVKHLTKIPLLLKEDEEGLRLEGHMAKANSHLKFIENNNNVTIIFDGPHGYISPTWYDDPSKGVPTWNFSTVIITGRIKVIDDNEWLLNSVRELSEKYEKNDLWKDKVDNDFIKNLSSGITGVEILVDTIESKFKLSQNQSLSNQSNVMKALQLENEELSSLMESFQI